MGSEPTVAGRSSLDPGPGGVLSFSCPQGLDREEGAHAQGSPQGDHGRFGGRDDHWGGFADPGIGGIGGIGGVGTGSMGANLAGGVNLTVGAGATLTWTGGSMTGTGTTTVGPAAGSAPAGVDPAGRQSAALG